MKERRNLEKETNSTVKKEEKKKKIRRKKILQIRRLKSVQKKVIGICLNQANGTKTSCNNLLKVRYST